jgi:hypothetical protein
MTKVLCPDVTNSLASAGYHALTNGNLAVKIRFDDSRRKGDLGFFKGGKGE